MSMAITEHEGRHWSAKVGWFVGLWTASVLALVAVAYLIRLLVR